MRKSSVWGRKGQCRVAAPTQPSLTEEEEQLKDAPTPALGALDALGLFFLSPSPLIFCSPKTKVYKLSGKSPRVQFSIY